MHSCSPILHKTPFILPLPRSTHPPTQYSPSSSPSSTQTQSLHPLIPWSTLIQSLHPAAPSFPPLCFSGSFESLLMSIHHSLIVWDVCIPLFHSFHSLLAFHIIFHTSMCPQSFVETFLHPPAKQNILTSDISFLFNPLLNSLLWREFRNKYV